MQRMERLRQRMQEEGLDALIVRDVNDLIWATGFAGVFDSEEAHTAVVTRDACIIHTDSRYAAALRTAADGGPWQIDDSLESAAAFAARVLEKTSGSGTAGAAGAAGAADAAGAGLSVGIDRTLPLYLYRSFTASLPGARFVEGPSIPLALRARKDAAEAEALRRVQDLAQAAFLEALGEMHVGTTEREAAFLLDVAFRRLGADGNSFSTIVASGEHGANPHAVPTERRFAPGDLIVFDFGAQRDGYCSDTTRMVSVGGPNPEQERAWNAVRRANETVEARLRPGVTGREMHELALEVLADEGFGGLMGHGLGHGVGLQIHELPNLNSRNDLPLEAGNVVTVEPGVYVEGSFGIRLEDYGILTETGFESFCTLPHELFVI